MSSPRSRSFPFWEGLSIMHLSDKEPLIGILERGNDVIEKIFKWIAIISPLGIFAHIAVAAGTLYVNAARTARILFYWICGDFIDRILFFANLDLQFNYIPLSADHAWVPHRMRPGLCDGGADHRDPFYYAECEQTSDRRSGLRNIAQTTLPLGLTFVQVGNGLILLFMLFISFYFRHPFTLSEKFILPILTVPILLPLGFDQRSFLFRFKMGLPHGSLHAIFADFRAHDQFAGAAYRGLDHDVCTLGRAFLFWTFKRESKKTCRYGGEGSFYFAGSSFWRKAILL